MDKPLEIAIRLSPKQLDHAVPVLEELIQEMVEERQKGERWNSLQIQLSV